MGWLLLILRIDVEPSRVDSEGICGMNMCFEAQDNMIFSSLERRLSTDSIGSGDLVHQPYNSPHHEEQQNKKQ